MSTNTLQGRRGHLIGLLARREAALLGRCLRDLRAAQAQVDAAEVLLTKLHTLISARTSLGPGLQRATDLQSHHHLLQHLQSEIKTCTTHLAQHQNSIESARSQAQHHNQRQKHYTEAAHKARQSEREAAEDRAENLIPRYSIKMN